MVGERERGLNRLDKENSAESYCMETVNPLLN